VHSCSMAGFQRSRCGLPVASAYGIASLLMDVDARDFAMIIRVFADILT